jgi:hypothetical protein
MGQNRAHTWPVGDVICARAEVRKLATEHVQQALRGIVIEPFYFVFSKIEDLLDARVVVISDYQIRRAEGLTLNKLALVPIMNPVWSKLVTQAVLLSGRPLFKCVPA